MDKLLRTEEVASILGYASRTLDNWRFMEDKRLPYIKMGRSVRYKASDVKAFMDELQHEQIGE
jgi:excisionase family DNA binding protein